MTASMTKLMTVTASTKRFVETAGKYATTATTYLTNVMCLPIDPVPLGEASDRPTRNVLGSPLGLFQTVVNGGLDIIPGHILVAGGVEYNIRMTEPWAASTNLNDAYMKLTLEKVKP